LKNDAGTDPAKDVNVYIAEQAGEIHGWDHEWR
jgi:hypothetical protein